MDPDISQGLAWSAGFFDGEGSTSATQEGRLAVTIGQTDREVLDRFRSAVNAGFVSGPYQYQRRVNKTWAEVWSYRAYGYDGLVVLEALWPWLGSVKKGQALYAVTACKPIRPRGWCRKGLHDKSKEGATAPDGRCRVCRNNAKSGRTEPALWSIPEFLKV